MEPKQGKIRRVVTGHDENGKAVVIFDELAPAVHTHPLRPGHISVDLWRTDSMPVVLRASEPDPTAGPKRIHPAPQGTVFRISEIAPETEAIRTLDAQAAREVFRAMGNEKASTAGSGGRHPFMHRTETLDYAVVLSGEITLLLDDQDVVLREGDVVIQRGTNHAWSNRSNRPALMLYVLIAGQYDPELAHKLGGAA
jgi:mannose-6-phosphate isomerase-like protein (cupin superfamily)